ncbi:MAG: alpha-isopropylmalate synthase regulatory domain-containing protein, partial [Thermodesulfobacteriota bacterium]
STIPTATVQVSFKGDVFTETASGNGPIDASFTAVKNLVKRRVRLEEFLIQAITRGSDDLGKVHVQVEHKGENYYGFSAHTDIVTASVEAFLDALGKIA